MVSPSEKYTTKVRSTTKMNITTTVRVRIFVSVSPCGGYLAWGAYSYDVGEHKEETAHHPCDTGYWIEADLPVPGTQPTLTATITRA